CFVRNVGERAISIVMEKDVAPPESTEQIIPAVIVVVAHANAGLPSGSRDSRLLRDVCEGSIAIVLVKMCRGNLPRRPVCIQPVAVSQIDVQPSVVVVVEESNAAALGFDNEFL